MRCGGRRSQPWGQQAKGTRLDMRELTVDHGSGLALLAMDTTLHDLDTSLAPAAPQKWTSNAILRVGDQCIGQGSDKVRIDIGG